MELGPLVPESLRDKSEERCHLKTPTVGQGQGQLLLRGAEEMLLGRI